MGDAVVTKKATTDHLQNLHWLLFSALLKAQSSKPLLDPSWGLQDIIALSLPAMSLCWTANTSLLP